MIIDRLENKNSYYCVHPLIEEAFRFIDKCVEVPKAPGRYEIKGVDLYAMVQEYTPSALETPRFETHDRYIDIQCMIAGSEYQRYAPKNKLKKTVPYDAEADIAFYAYDGNGSDLKLDTGCFVIYFPQDGHMPSVPDGIAGRCQRIIIKIKC